MRLDKAKDAKRRARKQLQKAIHAFGVAITAARVIEDKQEEPDSCDYCGIRGCEGECYLEEQ